MTVNSFPDDPYRLDKAALVKLIEYHNRRYWEQGEPEISDDDYDHLMRALELIDPEHPLIGQVHAPVVASDGKVRHGSPMLSLAKVYSLEELLEWATKHARRDTEVFKIQPKYDGISANYVDGVLATRGDGVEGENISAKLPLIELETTGYRGAVDRPVRGEIVIRDDVFKDKFSNISRKDGKFYKNSRNAVAGIMGLKDITGIQYQIEHYKAFLTLVDYDMISYSVKFSELKERWPALVGEIEALPYPLDGIVIKLADSAYSQSLGVTAHHPRGQVAFKFSGIRKTAKLLDVKWSFGKNCLTPVARIEPVDIGGITIQNASLHNVQNIIDKDIQINDLVTVERAGDVIPYIVSAEPGEERRDCIISNCPCCGHELVRQGPELCCVNPECFETLVQRLTAAVRNIGVERLGEPNIRRMMQTLGVKSLKDIFSLTREDILKLEGFKDKSADNLLREIAGARKVADYNLLAALNIQGIGVNIARQLLNLFTLDELAAMDELELEKQNGIGPERARVLVRELRAQKAFIDELRSCVEVMDSKGGGGQRKTICFTGKMPEKRSYYEQLAEAHGYQAADSVSGELSLLVAADPEASGGKLSKARKAGVAVVALEDWLASLGTDAEDEIKPEDSGETEESGQLTFGF
jgi:DNA ligase (NAD+)